MSQPRSETQRVWLALVDARHARLLEGELTPPGRRQLMERDALEAKSPNHKNESERFLPDSALDEEERLHPFAHQAVKWLYRQLQQRAIGKLTVFCTLRMLGPLREACPKVLLLRLDLRHGDLLRFTERELTRHPDVEAVFA